MSETDQTQLRFEPLVNLVFTSEPKHCVFKKAAPTLPAGIQWSVGMHYDANEFEMFVEVEQVIVDVNGNVTVWLEHTDDEGTIEEVTEYYQSYGWSLSE